MFKRKYRGRNRSLPLSADGSMNRVSKRSNLSNSVDRSLLRSTRSNSSIHTSSHSSHSIPGSNSSQCVLKVFGSPAKKSFLNQIFIKSKRRDIRNSLLFVSSVIDDANACTEVSLRKSILKSSEASKLNQKSKTSNNGEDEDINTSINSTTFSETSLNSDSSSESLNPRGRKKDNTSIESADGAHFNDCFNVESTNKTLTKSANVTKSSNLDGSVRLESGRKMKKVCSRELPEDDNNASECSKYSELSDSSISKLSQVCRKKAVTNEDETNDNVFSQCFEDKSSSDATKTSDNLDISESSNLSELSQTLKDSSALKNKLDDSTNCPHFDDCFDDESTLINEPNCSNQKTLLIDRSTREEEIKTLNCHISVSKRSSRSSLIPNTSTGSKKSHEDSANSSNFTGEPTLIESLNSSTKSKSLSKLSDSSISKLSQIRQKRVVIDENETNYNDFSQCFSEKSNSVTSRTSVNSDLIESSSSRFSASLKPSSALRTRQDESMNGSYFMECFGNESTLKSGSKSSNKSTKSKSSERVEPTSLELGFVEKSRMSGFLDQTVGDEVNKSMSKLIEEFERSKNAIMSGKSMTSSEVSELIQKMKPSISKPKETVNTTTNEKSSATANSTRFSETSLNSDSSSESLNPRGRKKDNTSIESADGAHFNDCFNDESTNKTLTKSANVTKSSNIDGSVRLESGRKRKQICSSELSDSSISKLSQKFQKKVVTDEDDTNDNVFSQCFEDTSSCDVTSDNRLESTRTTLKNKVDGNMNVSRKTKSSEFVERGRKTEKIRRGEKGIDKTVSMGFLSEIFNDEAGLNKLEEEIRASRMSEKSNVCTPEFVGRLVMSPKASLLLQKMKPSISDKKGIVNTTTNEKSSATANSTRFSETSLNSDSSSESLNPRGRKKDNTSIESADGAHFNDCFNVESTNKTLTKSANVTKSSNVDGSVRLESGRKMKKVCSRELPEDDNNASVCSKYSELSDSSISKLSQICRKKAVTNEDETNDNVFSQCFEDTSSYDATSDNRLESTRTSRFNLRIRKPTTLKNKVDDNMNMPRKTKSSEFVERGRKTEKIRRGEKGIDKTVSMGFLSEIFNDEAGLNKLEEEIRASRMSEKSNVCTPEFVGRLAMSPKASLLLQKMKPSISDKKETVNTTTNEKSSATANSTRFSETFINSDSSNFSVSKLNTRGRKKSNNSDKKSSESSGGSYLKGCFNEKSSCTTISTKNVDSSRHRNNSVSSDTSDTSLNSRRNLEKLNSSSSDLDDAEIDECNNTINASGWSGLFVKPKQNTGKMVMVSNRVGIVKTVRAGKTVDKYVILNPDGTIQKQIKRRYRWLTERCKNFIKTKMSEKYSNDYQEPMNEFIDYLNCIIETVTKNRTNINQLFMNSVFIMCAKYGIIRTPKMFYNFAMGCLPRNFVEKVAPQTRFKSTSLTIDYDIQNVNRDVLDG